MTNPRCPMMNLNLRNPTRSLSSKRRRRTRNWCLNWRLIEIHGKSDRSRRTAILRRREPPVTFAWMDGSSGYRCDLDLVACHSCLLGF